MSSGRDLPTLNLLVAFEAAGRHLSFKLAAEQISVTPSAVSQQIQLLESQLGVPLFVRHNRALSFTDAGQIYWQKVQQQLSQLRQATADIRQQQNNQTLRVSIMPPVARRIVFPRFSEFEEAHPELRIHIETSLENTDLTHGQADLAIRFGLPPWNGLRHEKLSDVAVCIICPVGFTERYQLHRSTPGLHEMPIIEMDERPDAWHRLFRDMGLPPHQGKRFHVDDYPAAIEAAETLGAALALWPLEKPLLNQGRIEAPFPPQGPIDEAIYAVYPEHKANSPGLRSFIDWISTCLQEID